MPCAAAGASIPEQAAVVERIFRDFVAGHSPRRIAQALNVEDIPGPGGRRRRSAAYRPRSWEYRGIATRRKPGRPPPPPPTHWRWLVARPQRPAASACRSHRRCRRSRRPGQCHGDRPADRAQYPQAAGLTSDRHAYPADQRDRRADHCKIGGEEAPAAMLERISTVPRPRKSAGITPPTRMPAAFTASQPAAYQGNTRYGSRPCGHNRGPAYR